MPSQNSSSFSTSPLYFFSLCILFCSLFPSLSIALNPSEHSAFLDIYNSMGGQYWINYFDPASDPCAYIMVRCDITETTITKLNLGSNNLTGQIHPSIGNFPNVKQINLRGNKLTGNLPDSIAQLSSIERLSISNNFLTGPFPESIGSLTTLNELYIDNNQFTSLPATITNLMKLTLLQADHNQLTGNLPSLDRWIFMKNLFLDSNKFSGVIPEFPINTQLEVFSIGYNNISGPIPSSIANAQKLTHFLGLNNSLSGTLPAALTQLPNLWMLYVSDNFFYGTLPEFSLSLNYIFLDYNQFHGNIPSSWYQMQNTSYVSAFVNHLNGSLSQQFLNFPHYNFSCNAINSPICPDCGPCELCGDGFCDALGQENCATCPQDCGAAPCGVCGDGVCESGIGETCSSCFTDCGVCGTNRRCPGTPLECTGRGTCSNQICTCNPGFTGPACESLVTQVGVNPNPDNPSVTIGSAGAAFRINVKQLTEYNPLGQVVQFANLTAVPLTLIESDIINENGISLHNWTYTGFLPGYTECFVTITIVLYRNATTVVFANETFPIAAQTLKYTLGVRNWPFKSARNTFGITFSAEDSSLGNTCLQSQKNSVGNVQWIKIILPSGDALFAEFTDVVQLDTKIIHGNFEAPSDGEVELRVPHFWDELVFDPNFSLLVTDLKTTARECFKKTKLPNWAIIIISILGTFGLMGAVVGSIYLHRKWKQRRLVKEAQSAHSMDASGSDVGMVRV